ncbi:hypothetical protein Tco_1433694 [Tanacetum coccineum]
MSTSTHPIIILYDFDVEDALSSTNTPIYTPASPNYSPPSQRNTSSDPSEESKDRSASLTISPFHDDPYMKIMQAYNDTSNELPIPLPRAPIAPPTVLPPSLVESSHMTRLERHEEQIDAIPNHLDELPLERIEHMHDDEIILARVRISTLEMLIEDIQIYVCRSYLSYILYCDDSYLYVSGITMVLLPFGFLEPLCPGIMDMINNQDIEHVIPPTPPRDTEPPVRSPISLSPSSSVGSSS